MTDTRRAYPSDVSDDEWAFLAPYLTLMRHDAPQRQHLRISEEAEHQIRDKLNTQYGAM